MVMSLRERLEAEAKKKAAEIEAKAVASALPPSPSVSAPMKVETTKAVSGRLAGLIKKTVPATPVAAPAPTRVIQPAATTPATAVAAAPPEPPKQDLSEAELTEFKRQLAYLEANIEQKELIGQVVRSIMMMWRKNPQFSSSMTNAEEDIVCRGFMRAFNVAARRKTEEQGKKTAKKATVSELDELMRGAGFNTGGDDLGKMFGG